MPNVIFDNIHIIEFLLLIGTAVSTITSAVISSRNRTIMLQIKEEILDAVRKEFLTVGYRETIDVTFDKIENQLEAISKTIEEVRKEGCMRFRQHSRLPYGGPDSAF